MIVQELALENRINVFREQAKDVAKTGEYELRRLGGLFALEVRGMREGREIFRKKGLQAINAYVFALEQQERNIRRDLREGRFGSVLEAARQKKLADGIPYRIRGLRVALAELAA